MACRLFFGSHPCGLLQSDSQAFEIFTNFKDVAYILIGQIQYAGALISFRDN